MGVREIVKFTKEIVRQTTQSKEMDYRDAVVKSLQYHFVSTVVNFHQNYLPNQHFLSKLTFAKFFGLLRISEFGVSAGGPPGAPRDLLRGLLEARDEVDLLPL